MPFDRRRTAQRGEALRPAVRPEQRARERSVRVGQGDHHRRASRPDVQGLRIEGELASRVQRRDVQLLVAVVEEVESLVERAGGEQLATHRRACAVGADHDVGVGENLAGRRLERHRAGLRIEPDELMVEHHPHSGSGLGGIEQGLVERCPADRVDRPISGRRSTAGSPVDRRRDGSSARASARRRP